MFMLPFAGCDNDHITPCKDQQSEYAKVGYAEYTGKGVTSPKGSTASMPKTACTVPRASTARTPVRPGSSRRVSTSPLPMRAKMNCLPRMATGLGMTMSPSPQGQLATYVVQGNNEPLATRAIGRACCARQLQAPYHNGWLGHNFQWSWRHQTACNKLDWANCDPSSWLQ